MIDVNSLWNHYRNLLIFTAVTQAIIQPENIQLFQFKSFKTAFYLGPFHKLHFGRHRGDGHRYEALGYA